ncbi:hypothetical protein A3I27_01985 [Candidatus Giovannonibacteria bacterium RIFCSPLOWO2_02_FULL_43_11b]|uniref:POTRA domain-containing protein n=1 Tax=Candidatus Giovannonibacteria bacterium RIFCSPHIGHO2_12_FULL_43_15 TaxID=1798341 RepID=A0A1F5WQX1_9BACT|nr:MAG: hypothetical protein A2739_01985 [Candidatus Giovannonibacteria bacterium RIFCSPHIGHO2_01_FULL_43_100]OGF67844.1 MAG: hypothetical protein A3B97_01015 [Candidatus Giovannonibacteria bacterium RIFCSPHIGHO2_02_FULL_43_32]OGF78004.1 MAG: hypothetical protein A3F23_03370 [Candidatus Giovannonibacteria bacterium RIFCSPHIGHO2_12_FULL_43_15]OGF79525.1 MAG: hypothetical protein A3A15_02235 [Candidatus Giovannonibacteria bacterium RIFCSPLOWO2_01_FULL_43_60]OGF89254.1 MAG: hypothetical protein A3
MSLRQDLLKTSHRRRKKDIFTKILFGICVLGIVSAIATFLFYIPALRVSNIIISGLDKNNAKELHTELFEILGGRKWLIVPKNHILFLPKKNIEEFLSGKYGFRDFAVAKKFPSTIDISITERKTWAVWCRENGNNCLLLDKEGLAFERSVIFFGSSILKIMDAREEDFLGKNILPPEKFNRILQMTEDAPKIIQGDIESIYIKKSGETYYLYPKSGIYFIIDAETDVERALENLTLALKSGKIKAKADTLEYIDLRFPDKVFYKFK